MLFHLQKTPLMVGRWNQKVEKMLLLEKKKGGDHGESVFSGTSDSVL